MKRVNPYFIHEDWTNYRRLKYGNKGAVRRQSSLCFHYVHCLNDSVENLAWTDPKQPALYIAIVTGGYNRAK